MSDKLVRICNRVSSKSDTDKIDLRTGELLLAGESLLMHNGYGVKRLNYLPYVYYDWALFTQEHFVNGSARSIIYDHKIGLANSSQEYYHKSTYYMIVTISITGYSDAEFCVYFNGNEYNVNSVSCNYLNSIPVECMYSLTDANNQPVCWCTINSEGSVYVYARNFYDYSDNNSYDTFPIPYATRVKIMETPIMRYDIIE